MFEAYFCDKKFQLGGQCTLLVFVGKFVSLWENYRFSSCHYLYNFGNFQKGESQNPTILDQVSLWDLFVHLVEMNDLVTVHQIAENMMHFAGLDVFNI